MISWHFRKIPRENIRIRIKWEKTQFCKKLNFQFFTVEEKSGVLPLTFLQLYFWNFELLHNSVISRFVRFLTFLLIVSENLKKSLLVKILKINDFVPLKKFDFLRERNSVG